LARANSWICNVSSIEERLKEHPREHFGRVEVGRIFGVSDSQARAIMRRAGGRAPKPGVEATVPAKDLLCWLTGPEVKRLVAAAAARAEGEEDRALKSVRAPVSPRFIVESELVRLRNLAGVVIQPTPGERYRAELRVGFDDLPDLLRRLWQLSRAISHDEPTFQEISGGAA